LTGEKVVVPEGIKHPDRNPANNRHHPRRGSLRNTAPPGGDVKGRESKKLTIEGGINHKSATTKAFGLHITKKHHKAAIPNLFHPKVVALQSQDAGMCVGCTGLAGPCMTASLQKLTQSSNVPQGMMFCDSYTPELTCKKGYVDCNRGKEECACTTPCYPASVEDSVLRSSDQGGKELPFGWCAVSMSCPRAFAETLQGQDMRYKYCTPSPSAVAKTRYTAEKQAEANAAGIQHAAPEGTKVAPAVDVETDSQKNTMSELDKVNAQIAKLKQSIQLMNAKNKLDQAMSMSQGQHEGN